MNIEWNSLETAPRDGTPVILALKTAPCRVVGGACWNPSSDHPWIISDDRRYGHAHLFAVADHHVIAWASMPLPPNNEPKSPIERKRPKMRVLALDP